MRPNTLKSIRRTLVGGLSAVALSVASLTSHAAPITEEEAHAIGMDAYIYLYPLLSMDVTVSIGGSRAFFCQSTNHHE